MVKLRLERKLPYEAAKLMDMVGDVEHYPDFIPWITRLNIYNRRDGNFDADVSVGFKLLSETFSTRVTRDAEAGTVDFNLIRGPFRKLIGKWHFTPAGHETDVVFDMDIDIKNPIIDALFRANFDRAVARLMNLFETRAAGLYGNS